MNKGIHLSRLLAVMALLAIGSTAVRADYARIEQDHPSVSYTGSWVTYDGPALSGGSLAATSQAGATVSVQFTGTGISWISYESDLTRGSTRLYLGGLNDTQHMLTIEVTSEPPSHFTTIAVR